MSVDYGSDVLARQLAFGGATSYVAVPPGAQTVQFTAPGEHAAMSVSMAPDTMHTIVVLDDSSGLRIDSSGLRIDALVDSAGSQIMPKGGAAAGFGGTAPRLPGSPAPWLLMIAAGALLTSGGFVGLRRSHCILT